MVGEADFFTLRSHNERGKNLFVLRIIQVSVFIWPAHLRPPGPGGRPVLCSLGVIRSSAKVSFSLVKPLGSIRPRKKLARLITATPRHQQGTDHFVSQGQASTA
ncbi:hypothetical protein E2C01_040665 [Portunus trituberculatus]|uniref:Uncharacterized protein n=1 Tax=Portunus trituberculatus TaxID=210409 RepID=A0A5B7FRD9_PORTR|nr:hypothetical protein [Portunus trituberculatus]